MLKTEMVTSHDGEQALPEWPVALVEVYIHDALGGRQWASHSECEVFVDNLRTAWAPLVLPEPSPAHPLPSPATGKTVETVAASTTSTGTALEARPSSSAGEASGGDGGGGGCNNSDAGDDSSSDGEMIVEEGGHVEAVLPGATGGGGGAAAIAAAATAAARALARRREQAKTFSGFEKICLDGEDENIPAVTDRFAR